MVFGSGRGSTEAVFALIVRIIVAIGLTSVPQRWRDKWEQFEWRNGILLLMSVVFVPVLLYGLHCWGGVNVPGYRPSCDFGGFVMDALYVGVLAYLYNYVSEDMYRRAMGSRRRLSGAFFNNVWFWIFAFTVALEASLLVLGVGWQLSLAISIIASIVTTMFGLYLQRCLFPAWQARGAIRSVTTDLLWWVVLAVKIIVHLLPIPIVLKPMLSIALTIILFIVVNVILKIHRRYGC